MVATAEVALLGNVVCGFIASLNAQPQAPGLGPKITSRRCRLGVKRRSNQQLVPKWLLSRRPLAPARQIGSLQKRFLIDVLLKPSGHDQHPLNRQRIVLAIEPT